MKAPPGLRPWHLAAVAALLALALHLWGLYRVTGPPAPPWFPGADKVEHAIGFALPVLCLLVAAGWRRRDENRRPTGRPAVVVAVVFAAHAVASEVIQGTVYQARTGDPYDVVADLVGVVAGLLAARAILQLGRVTVGVGR